jgi:hypothetical protein
MGTGVTNPGPLARLTSIALALTSPGKAKAKAIKGRQKIDAKENDLTLNIEHLIYLAWVIATGA